MDKLNSLSLSLSLSVSLSLCVCVCVCVCDQAKSRLAWAWSRQSYACQGMFKPTTPLMAAFHLVQQLRGLNLIFPARVAMGAPACASSVQHQCQEKHPYVHD